MPPQNAMQRLPCAQRHHGFMPTRPPATVHRRVCSATRGGRSSSSSGGSNDSPESLPPPGSQPTWQQRQQTWQQRHGGKRAGRRPQQQQQQQQRGRVPGQPAPPRGRFADCQTFQAVCARLTQLHEQQQQQPDQQQDQAPAAPLLLSAGDTAGLMEQLAAINRAPPAADPFAEAQALQRLLPAAYTLLDRHAAALPPAADAADAAAPAAARPPGQPMPPRQLLRCVSCLAGLKFSQPEQLAAVLEGVAARSALSGLGCQGLASLVVNLAAAGVRPSNVWLVAFMQAAQQQLPRADLGQLAQLLSGLLKLGVKPAASWLDSLQDRAVQCLVEQAVRFQVSRAAAGHHQQQQQPQQPQAAAMQGPGGGNSSSDSGRTAPAAAGCRLHDVAQLVSAFAQARHQLTPQLAGALFGGATTSCLAAAEQAGPPGAADLADADVAALVELLAALGDLRLLPPPSWMQLYFSSTAKQLQRYRPWQLAGSVAALGKLGTQATPGNMLCCADWVAAVLLAVQQQLDSLAARDLSALLSGLAQLELALPRDQLLLLLTEVQHKLPRLNPSALAAVLQAAVQLEQQQQQQQGHGPGRGGPALLSEAWMAAILREAANKLPMFAAADLSQLLLALQGSGFQPSRLWVEAAAAHLHGKLTVLDPGQLVAVWCALPQLGLQPERRWLAAALASLDGRLMELEAVQLQQLLQELLALPSPVNDQLISPGWLQGADWAIQQLAAAEAQEQDTQEQDTLAASCQQLLQRLLEKERGAAIETAAGVVAAAATRA